MSSELVETKAAPFVPYMASYRKIHEKNRRHLNVSEDFLKPSTLSAHDPWTKESTKNGDAVNGGNDQEQAAAVRPLSRPRVRPVSRARAREPSLDKYFMNMKIEEKPACGRKHENGYVQQMESSEIAAVLEDTTNYRPGIRGRRQLEAYAHEIASIGVTDALKFENQNHLITS